MSSEQVAQMIESALIYTPLIIACTLLISCRIYKRLQIAIILTTLWQLSCLPWLDYFAQSLGFWAFPGAGTKIVALPLSYYFSWVLWWGVVATILVGKLPTKHARWWALGLIILVDLLAMPLPQPSLILSPGWIYGECILLIFGLLPSLMLAHWTLSWKCIGGRSTIMTISFIIGPLLLSPILGGANIEDLLKHAQNWSYALNLVFLILSILCLIPVISAIQAFATLGLGTPLPFDPPRKLVITGIYSYIKNPIQLGAIALTILWAIYTNHFAAYLLAINGIVYCLGFTRWSEKAEMIPRFGDAWADYQTRVRSWLPHLTPRLAENHVARLFIDFNCSTCAGVAHWFSRRRVIGLEIADISKWPHSTKLERITYLHPCGKTDQGIAAIAQSLQHIHIVCAFIGWILALPIINTTLQLSLDAAGASSRQTETN